MKKTCNLLMTLLILLMLSSCSEWNDLVDSVSGSGDDEVATNAPNQNTDAGLPSAQEDANLPETGAGDDSSNAQYSDYYHHYNPKAFHGRAVAIVFCPKQSRLDSCKINGRSMRYHGTDYGRYVWALWGDTKISGDIVCKQGGKTLKYKVKGSGGMQYGDC